MAHDVVTGAATRRLDADVLAIDAAQETARIAANMVRIVGRELRRRGVVVAISGGVDSAVCAALAVRAFGPARVFGLMLPEHESSPHSLSRARLVASQLGIAHAVEDLGPALEALGCYRRRDEAIRGVFPDYGPDWKCKIAIAGGRDGTFNYFKLVVQSPAGATREARMPVREYLQVVAATNFKQRMRKMVEYYHADRLHYAVVGTPNRLEYDQGFFVKNGDGSADLKPIAHLYKTQVYALARHLDIPEEIRGAAPSTDTYSLPQGQDEFYFALPWHQMDIALWALDHGVDAEELAARLEIPAKHASAIYADIAAKRSAARYLHSPPLLVESAPEART
jgi:NAD+ synthase